MGPGDEPDDDASGSHLPPDSMSPSREKRKRLGQVFTPEEVAHTLVQWVIKSAADRLLDPACGDGRFLGYHNHSTGVEFDAANVALARHRAPQARVHRADFFQWAAITRERFDAAVGNPPFIRYQHFTGRTRHLALDQAAKLGACLNGLASAWAPFLVVTAGLLKPGGRMAFVVPAEIGHAPYAAPVVEFLCSHFTHVRIIAIREKLFPHLSESVWLLVARGFGGQAEAMEFSIAERFRVSPSVLGPARRVSIQSWREQGCRLRKFLLSEESLETYRSLTENPGVVRLGALASIGIGYVSGANDFFHLRPSEASRRRIPASVLRVTIRRARQLPPATVDEQTVQQWLRNDEPVLLLDLKGTTKIPTAVADYLNSEEGQKVRGGYKCRNRHPWYAIPDVREPDAFLAYMSGRKPVLVRNDAGCVCTNSLHAVLIKTGIGGSSLQRAWAHPLVDLSCELEGHPLGGGLLKLEPREASNVAVPTGEARIHQSDLRLLQESTAEMRAWRHYA